MFWAFLIIFGLMAGAVVLLRGLIPNARHGWSAYAVLCGVIAMLVAALVFWREAILALAISALIFLAVAVMLQKVTPKKAVAGALAALLLLFAFTWLARQMANVFLFDRAPQLPSCVHSVQFNSFGEFTPGDYLPVGDLFPWPPQKVAVALGIACLVGAAFLKGRSRAVMAFLGALLLALTVPGFLAGQGFSFEENPILRDPFVRLALLLLGAALLFRLLTSSKQAGRP